MPQQKNRRERVMGCAQCGRDTLPFGNVRTDQKAATLADTLLAMAGGVATQGAVGIADIPACTVFVCSYCDLKI